MGVGGERRGIRESVGEEGELRGLWGRGKGSTGRGEEEDRMRGRGLGVEGYRERGADNDI